MKIQGDGVYIDKNSNRYEGQWRNDRAEGYGIKVFAKGDKHEGYYSNDKRNGFGTYYWANGCVLTGFFVVGWCPSSLLSLSLCACVRVSICPHSLPWVYLSSFLAFVFLLCFVFPKGARLRRITVFVYPDDKFRLGMQRYYCCMLFHP